MTASSTIPIALRLDLAAVVPDPGAAPMTETLQDVELAAEGLPGPRGEPVEPDGDTLDLIERHARDRLRAWVVGGEAIAPRIGRFTLLQRLGSGGMGTVYSAYDDELDRRVALKFLHRGRAEDPRAQQRLLREAQALARLSHPNLVPVFEVGRYEEQVYLAMELVRGRTMRVWVDEQAPGWRAVLAAWLDVGRALQLVHHEGLVHRDVKPDNVIVADDGRARLVDFGLAREVGEPGSGAGSVEPGSASGNAAESWGSSRLKDSITHSHTVVGTPAYLSPEQRFGEPCGPAADQYGFCVSLYEGLYGCRPPGPTEHGALIDVPAGKDVPVVLRRALSRGLSLEARERFGSMEALVAELSRPLQRKRWGWLGLGGVLVLGGVLGAAAFGREAAVEPPAPCVGVERDFDRVWGDGPRAKWEQAGEHGVVAAVDALAEDWGAARREACEATRVSGVQSVAVLDRRVACLDRLRDRAGALVDRPVDGSLLAAGLAELTAPSDCLLPGVAEGGWTPVPEGMRGEVEEIERELAKVAPLTIAGEIDAARGVAEGALRRAEAVGYEPTIAEALLAVGMVETKDFHAKAAREALERAANLAEANGELLLKEEVLSRLVRLASDVEADREEALRAWHRDAATLRRAGPSRYRAARLMAEFGDVRRLHRDRLGAEVSFRAAEAMLREQGPRLGPARAAVLRNLAYVLAEQQRSNEADEMFALAGVLEGVKPLDPSKEEWGRATLGDARLGEGNALLTQGRHEEARQRLQEALREYTRAYGKQGARVGRVHVSLAQLAVDEGELDVARRHAEEADLAFRIELGSDHPQRTMTLASLGTVSFEQRRMDDAVRQFRDALTIAKRHERADSLLLALHRSNLAEALAAVGQIDEAWTLASESLAVRASQLPTDHVDLAFPLRTIGQILVLRGETEAALPPLQRALALHERERAYPVEVARTRAWLGRAELAAGHSTLARASLELAVAEYVALGHRYAQDAAELRGLLDDGSRPF